MVKFMREMGKWCRELAKDFTALKKAYGPLSMSATEILDTELILTVMKQNFPGQNPERAWTVFNGHYYPALAALSQEQKRAVILARLHLPWLIGRRSWEDLLKL